MLFCFEIWYTSGAKSVVVSSGRSKYNILLRDFKQQMYLTCLRTQPYRMPGEFAAT